MMRLIRAWLLVLAFSGAAFASGPQKTMPLGDANIGNYGVRLRVTRGAWDYVKLTMRDTFKVWSKKGGSGANLILDPGYDFNTKSAGIARTTPFILNIGDYQGVDRPRSETDCSSCNSGDLDYRYCGLRCVQRGREAIMNWCQVRRPGYNGSDYPQVPWSVQGPTRTEAGNYFREYGFYLAPVASTEGGGLCPTSTAYYDFTQMQFCSNYFQYDRGSGTLNSTGGYQCEDAAESIIGIDIHYNARIYIFPNMRQEYAADPVDGWAPPVIRGPYAGYSGTANIAGYETSCAGASPGCTDVGDCGCSGWGCTAPRRYTVNGCNAGVANMPVYTWFGPLPSTIAGHNPLNAFNTDNGTYFRQGDDVALYLNINQMQIHSADRSSAFVRDCEPETFYTGQTSGGYPVYVTDSELTANCMRPKMYYDTVNLRWKQCDPFDTWNTDGSYNLNNDDAKYMYPGHPVTGGYGSPGVCGAQPCTGVYCANPPATRRTTNLGDLYNPGGGWYMMRILGITMDPANNRMVASLMAPDIRAEIGAAVDVHTNIFLFGDVDVRNKRLLGRIRLDRLDTTASIRLYSIDDTSCNPTYPRSCGGNWKRVNDGIQNPDRFIVEVTVDSLTLTPPAGDWFVGDCSDVVFDILVYKLTMCDLVNGLIKDMLLGILADALKNMIAPAIEGFTSTIPNMNDILGNPIYFNTVLIDPGIYMAGNINDWEYVPPTPYDNYTKRWPVRIKTGPTAAQNLADFRLAVGFKPIAFRPASNANYNPQYLEIDTNDPPLANSIYGIPTLMDPDTSMCATSNYCNTAANPDVEVHTGCARVHPKGVDTDGFIDTEDYCQGTPGYATSGSYRDQKTGAIGTVGDAAVIKEFWQGPIPYNKQPPKWCMTVGADGAPRTIRTGATAANFASWYPQSQWLSFHDTLDPNPVGGAAVLRNTFGGWDQMDVGTVLQQNVNSETYDGTAITYDASVHIHQRVFAQFLQAAFATGVGCIEFSARVTDDTAGGAFTSGFASLLSTDRFSLFMPELATLFPGWYAKVRISPVKTPHVRTGVGTINFTPKERVKDPTGGPLPIVNKQYSLAVAVPDLRVEVLVENLKTNSEVSVLTAYWSPVIGLYARAVRACYKLDPLLTDPQCQSTFTNVRTVSGYYEVFVDVNSPSLQTAFENTRDGFAAGTFSNPGVGTTRGSAAFVIEKTYCTTNPTKCNMLGFSQTLPTLMNSLIQIFLVTRLNFYNLTVDFLYVGADGPNEDNVPAGAPGRSNGGDYLGVYFRFLGNLNVFGLLDQIGGLAPTGRMQPMAVLKDANAGGLFNTNAPSFAVDLYPAVQARGSDMSYTYRIDQGFWRTPVNDAKLTVPPVVEGEHTLEIRAIEDSDYGTMAAKTPTVVKFRVDTVAPEVEILPSKKGYFGSYAPIKASDVQTGADDIRLAYKWDDDDEWADLSGDSVSLRWKRAGRHVLRVKALDLTGNTAVAARDIVVAKGAFGCAAGGSSDPSLRLLFGALAVLALRRKRSQRAAQRNN